MNSWDFEFFNLIKGTSMYDVQGDQNCKYNWDRDYEELCTL